MNLHHLKKTVETIKMPEEMKERLIRGCKAASEVKENPSPDRLASKTVWGIACACCLVVLLGIGVWQSGARNTSPITSEGDSTTSGNIAETDDKASANESNVQSNPTTVYREENQSLPSTIFAGLNVPTFIVYRGALYGAVSNQPSVADFVKGGDFVMFNAKYGYDAYLDEERPDVVAIFINGGFSVYQKLFEVRFSIDDISYGAAYEYLQGDTDDSVLEVIQKTDDYTVYRVVKAHMDTQVGDYVVDIAPMLKERLPNLFDTGERYAEFRWIAEPMDGNEAD